MQQMRGWLLIIGILSFIGLGIWWLVKLNTGIDDGANVLREEQKNTITSRLIDGKDYGTGYDEKEIAEFEALVVLRDQHDPDPVEDKRSSLKRGDVLAVRKLPHLWSDTERNSYLIVKIKMTGKEANMLLLPKKDGDEITVARARRIDVEGLGFSSGQVTENQPLEGKVFDTDIIETK